MTKRKKHFATVETIIDKETGEELKNINTSSYNIQSDNFVKTFIDGIKYINKLPLSLYRLVNELMVYVDYENNIPLTAGRRKKIAERLDQRLNTVDQGISKLCKFKVIIKYDNEYYLNPLLYGKGSPKDIFRIRNKLNVKFEDLEI